MTVAQLKPQARFRLQAIPERTGTVLRLGPGSAVVRYDGCRQKHIVKRRGPEIVADVTFDEPYKPVTISLGTQVERLPGR